MKSDGEARRAETGGEERRGGEETRPRRDETRGEERRRDERRRDERSTQDVDRNTGGVRGGFRLCFSGVVQCGFQRGSVWVPRGKMRVPLHFDPIFCGGSSETKSAFYNIKKGFIRENIAQTALAKEARYTAMATVRGPPEVLEFYKAVAL